MANAGSLARNCRDRHKHEKTGKDLTLRHIGRPWRGSIEWQCAPRPGTPQNMRKLWLRGAAPNSRSEGGVTDILTIRSSFSCTLPEDDITCWIPGLSSNRPRCPAYKTLRHLYPAADRILSRFLWCGISTRNTALLVARWTVDLFQLLAAWQPANAHLQCMKTGVKETSSGLAANLVKTRHCR